MPTFEKVTDLLRSQGLLPRVPARETEPFDVTREKLAFPAPRSARLQILARGETGAMTALAYSSMRGYGPVHPTVGELRVGYVAVDIPFPSAATGRSRLSGKLCSPRPKRSTPLPKTTGKTSSLYPVTGYLSGRTKSRPSRWPFWRKPGDVGSCADPRRRIRAAAHRQCGIERLRLPPELPHYITFQSSLDRIRQTRADGRPKSGTAPDRRRREDIPTAQKTRKQRKEERI